jgi:HEAT repeat protein
LTGLRTLWLSSLGIAGVALLIMFGLIASRWLLGWRTDSRERERRRLIPLLLGDAGDGAEVPHIAQWVWRDVLANLTVELIQLVRGSDRDRFIASAVSLGVPERLRHQLGSGSPRVRQAAAEALGYFIEEGSAEQLHDALSDPNPDVRFTAAMALAEAGQAPPARELVEKLKIGTRENSLLVTALFRELGRKRPEDLEALLGDKSVPAAARIAAVEALSQSGEYRLVPLIAAAADEADPDGRELPRYLRALASFAHPAAAGAVERSLGSTSPQVRSAAAEAAGKIGLLHLAGRLELLLSDPSWQVRFRSAEALAAMGDDGAEILRRMARDRGTAAGEASALILAEHGLALRSLP